MTNDQVNASRYIALRNPDLTFEVTPTQITVRNGGVSEVVTFTSITPAETLKRDLVVAVEQVRS
jgi:hypothetical protein